MFLPTQSSVFHNPYIKPYLAFSVENQNTSESVTSSEDEEFDEITIQDINLISIEYLSGFTHNPIVSLCVITPILLFLAATAVFIQIRTLQMLKQENSVNNKLMATQARIHIIFWPTIVISNTLADNIYPLSAITTPIFCTVLRFFFYFCVLSMILYSFYAALLRYLFCIHSERVTRFGKNRLITIIYWTFYLHTLVWALYTILTSFHFDHIPLINSCYGYGVSVFLMEYSTLDMAQRHFCILQSVEGKGMHKRII